MASKRAKKILEPDDDRNLVSLEEWRAQNFEPPSYKRLNNGVIRRLAPDEHYYDDDSLNEESLGSGIAVMIQICDALVHTALDAVKNTERGIKDRIKNCLLHCQRKK